MNYSKIGNIFVLNSDFEYKDFVIPAGFLWDGASIPYFARVVIGEPNKKAFAIASLIHDWLYYTHIYNRAKSDKILYNELRKSGVNCIKAMTMYISVKSFGPTAWENKTEDFDYLENLIKKIKLDKRDLNKYNFGIYNKWKEEYNG